MQIITEKSQPTGTAILHLGFRPFFLAAGIFAVLSIAIWMAIFVFTVDIAPPGLPSMTWHAHEMIYGYAAAVIAGFLLTAVRNWTGVQTLNGHGLAGLVALWVLARCLPFFAGNAALVMMMVTDLLFLLGLNLAILYPIIKVRQWKQIGIIAKLILLLASNLVFYLGVFNIIPDGERLGLYSGLYMVLAMVFVMGRRVVPFFIERGVDEQVSIHNRKWLDLSSLTLFALFWIADMAWPNSIFIAVLSVILFLMHGIRLYDWHTPGIWKKPLLWVLYLAYAFLVTGFALKAASVFFGVSPFLAVHAFAFGGIGMATLGMMSRVALGHTGRNVFEPPGYLFWIFLLLLLGGLVRVFLPLLAPRFYLFEIVLSQGLWIAAFGFFTYKYAPILIKPRVDGQYG